MNTISMSAKLEGLDQFLPGGVSVWDRVVTLQFRQYSQAGAVGEKTSDIEFEFDTSGFGGFQATVPDMRISAVCRPLRARTRPLRAQLASMLGCVSSALSAGPIIRLITSLALIPPPLLPRTRKSRPTIYRSCTRKIRRPS